MATRTLVATEETVLPAEDEVLHVEDAFFRVYLPRIGDGSGSTVVAASQILLATNEGRLEVCSISGVRLGIVPPRSVRTAVSKTNGEWSFQDAPASYPYARVTGAVAGEHTHDIEDVVGLQDALDDKSDLVHTHPISDVTALQGTLDGKASAVHSHVVSDTTGLQTALDGKASTAHSHDAADISTGTLGAARLPVATTAARGAAKVDNDSAGDPVALTSAGHGLAADPHPQYALDSEKGEASGIATLDSGGTVPSAQLAFGTAAGEVCEGDDLRLADSADASEFNLGSRQLKMQAAFLQGTATPLLLFFPSSGATKIAQFQQVGDVWSVAIFGGSSCLSINLNTLEVTMGGKVVVPASTATRASTRLPHGVAPTAPADGDMWTTTAGLFVRINGATVGPLS